MTLGEALDRLDSCDGDPKNGCETNLATTTTSCGSCGATCTNAHGTTSCAASACQPVCSAGYGNCNSVGADGCETSTDTSLTSCGACGATCAFANASATCSLGACAMGTCNAGFSNCDGSTANGCEHVGSTCCTDHVLPPSVNVDTSQWAASFLTAPVWNCNAAGTTTINSTTGTISSTSCGLCSFDYTNNVPQIGGGPNVMVVRLQGLTVSNNHVFKLVGDKPIVFLVAGNVVVDSGGKIDAGATGKTPGPGGSLAGQCTGQTGGVGGTSSDSGGGGGGGFGTAGGRGGIGNNTSATAGTAGAVSADADLQPLRGGCSGAKGGDSNASSASSIAGAGGGAFQISASGTISVTGTLTGGGGAATLLAQPRVARLKAQPSVAGPAKGWRPVSNS